MRSALQKISSAVVTPGSGGAVLAVWLVVATGCTKAGPGVNTFADDSYPESHWVTPSAEGVRASGAVAAVRERGWETASAPLEPMTVPHWPLWWEDPFEDKGSDDGQYAWTYEDFVAMPYCFFRYVLDTVAFPASAIVTLPGTPMVSDGYLSKQALGYDHDAIPGKTQAPGTTLTAPTTQPTQSE